MLQQKEKKAKVDVEAAQRALRIAQQTNTMGVSALETLERQAGILYIGHSIEQSNWTELKTD